MSGCCSREICKLCFDIIRVGFHVPNEIWQKVVLRGYEQETICLKCFTRIADEKSIKWDVEIKFYPISFVTHKERL